MLELIEMPQKGRFEIPTLRREVKGRGADLKWCWEWWEGWDGRGKYGNGIKLIMKVNSTVKGELTRKSQYSPSPPQKKERKTEKKRKWRELLWLNLGIMHQNTTSRQPSASTAAPEESTGLKTKGMPTEIKTRRSRLVHLGGRTSTLQ